MELDKLDTLNEVELRVELRRVLRLIDDIRHGSNDDCYYDYAYVQRLCKEAQEFSCKYCKVTSKHEHTLNESADTYCHPLISGLLGNYK